MRYTYNCWFTDNVTTLQMTAYNSYSKYIKLLIKSGAELNSRDIIIIFAKYSVIKVHCISLLAKAKLNA